MKYLTAAVCLLLPGLASAAPPSTIPDLIRSLQDTNLAIRMKAIRELGELGTAGRPAVPELCRLLREDENVEVRRQAAAALAQVGRPAVLELSA